MNNLPIISTPQPSGNAASASQSDNMAGSANNDQASAPFAQVLARKVDRPASSSASSPKADSPEQAGSTDPANPAQDQAVVPVDALSAILVQIPVEMRGASVMDRAALLASGNRSVAGIDPAAAAVPDVALLPSASADGSAPDVTAAIRNNLSAPATPGDAGAVAASASQNRTPATAARTDVIAAASGQQLLEDAQLQNMTNRPELAAAQPLTSALTSATAAASMAQSFAAAMPNMPADVRSNTNIQTVSTPLTSPAWPDDFSQKISWMISQKNQVAELHLNPPNLGPLDIVLKVSDNQATALFASPHANVRDAVENALPKLRELLADNGIMLGNATVSDQSARDRAPQEFAGRQSASTGGDSGKEIGEASAAGGSAPPAPTGRHHNGMVDTYA
ncbi:MAG TPA: flagellar hook-length control protein FliK [Gallionella sp.]|nr:flagellar hook-length control protein FliK [Gallionella sp.]